MELDLTQILNDHWTLLLFVVIAIGYLLSKIRLGGVPLGSTAGVLIAGLFFGHLGFPNIEGAATFGFTLFIFSVGLQAGPRFFSVFLEDGPRYVALALVVAITGATLAVLLFETILARGFGHATVLALSVLIKTLFSGTLVGAAGCAVTLPTASGDSSPDGSASAAGSPPARARRAGGSRRR